MRWLRIAVVLTGVLAFAAAAHAFGRGSTAPSTRELTLTLLGHGQGTWNGTDVYYSPTDGSQLPVNEGGQISYHWKTVKPLDFKIPLSKNSPFDATAQGDLTGSWQSSMSGTMVNSDESGVEPFTCSDTRDDIPSPVNANLSYQPTAGHAVLTLFPDVIFFPSVPLEAMCPVIFRETNLTATGAIVPQNLFQSPDAQADIVLPASVVTTPKRVTANFPHERIDTQNGSETEHLVNDGTVDVNPCGGYGDAVVTFIQGDASAGDESLGLGSTVSNGTMLTTKGRTRVELRLPDKSVLRIGPQSNVELNCELFGKSAEDRKVNAKLVVGDLWAKIAHLVGDGKFDVQTQNAVVGVRGTILQVTYRGGSTIVHAIQHSVSVRNRHGGRSILIKPPMCAKVVGGKAPTSYRC